MVRGVSVALATTAVLNVGAGLASVAMPELHAELMFASGVALDPLGLRLHVMLWLFVVAMGLGYGVASRDPERHLALLVAGGTGKVAAALVWAEMLARGIGAPLMAAGILFDGSLGVLFLVFAARVAAGQRAGVPEEA